MPTETHTSKNPTKVDRRGHNTAAVGEITRERILDVAEALFAASGPDAVSVRAIAAAAGVNLAAMNYHFGSKERLFEHIFRRRVVPLNAQRIRLLEEAIAAVGQSGGPSIESILTAFVTPPLEFSYEASGRARALVVMQFLGHAFSSPNEVAFLEAYYDEVRTTFMGALQKACPHLSIDDVVWRYNFLVGAIIYAMGGPARMTRLPASIAKSTSPAPVGSQAAIRELVTFAAAGFREAPSKRDGGASSRKPKLKRA